MKAIRAIVPAAGKGSRLQKISGDLPKAMFPVGNKPMLDFVLDNISFIDEKEIYIVVGYAKEKILEHLGDRYHYVEQKQQLGALDDFSSTDPDNVCVLKIRLKAVDLVGNERDVVYRFYRYSERKSFVTVELLGEDGQSSPEDAYGSFYVLHSFTQKLIEDAKRVVEGVEVDAASKY